MKRIFQISALILMISVGMLFTWHLWPDSYKINLDGTFAHCELRVPVKPGVVVFETAEKSAFLVEAPPKEGSVFPWSDVVYITVTTPDRTTKRLSGPVCRSDISYEGELVIRVEQNPDYAQSILKVSTGIAPSPSPSDFKKGAINLKIRNVKEDYNPNIPKLDDLPKSERIMVKNGGGVFALWLKVFQGEPIRGSRKSEPWLTPFNSEEIKAVKSAFNEAQETAKKIMGGTEK